MQILSRITVCRQNFRRSFSLITTYFLPRSPQKHNTVSYSKLHPQCLPPARTICWMCFRNCASFALHLNVMFVLMLWQFTTLTVMNALLSNASYAYSTRWGIRIYAEEWLVHIFHSNDTNGLMENWKLLSTALLHNQHRFVVEKLIHCIKGY